jgi:hypothetical protein
LSQHDEAASEEFGRWARARAGVAPVEQTKPEPTYEEKVADAVAGGADGNAGRVEDRGDRPRNLNDVIREGAALRKLQKWGW